MRLHASKRKWDSQAAKAKLRLKAGGFASL
jgi:hypothetical protein